MPTDPSSSEPAETAIDFKRLYQYRFRNVECATKQRTWDQIAPYLYRRMGSPARILDPAAGMGEFVNALPGVERWTVDLVEHAGDRDPAVKAIVADVFEADIPADYFDGVFVSNFLEHLSTQEEVARFLAKMLTVTAPDGVIAVMGPNFRYCAKSYFDYADHILALTDRSVSEHLYSAGFEIESATPRFLPFSFTGRLPNAPWMTRAYLRAPLAWRVLGKQFLVLARRPAIAEETS